ncbi:MAG: lysozyme [Litorimonas sp.]
MTRTLAISDTGLRLIKAFEGFRPDDRTLVTGTRVVGYGHRLETDDDPVHMSRADAEEQLLDDLEPIEEIVNDEVHAPLSQGQFDALCSLAFNIGPEAFRTSDIVRAMNNGRVLDAANGFDVWRKATVNGKTYVVDALMRRRTAEKSLFLRNEPAVPAPSAMLQPQPDSTAPFGPTDDGLPKVTIGEASGVIDAANIINADRVDPVDPSVGLLTLSDIAVRADNDDENDDDALIEDDELEGMDDDDLEEIEFADNIDDDLDEDDTFEDVDSRDDEDGFEDDQEEEDQDDVSDFEDEMSDDNIAEYDDDHLDDDDALDEIVDEDEEGLDAPRMDVSPILALAETDLMAEDASEEIVDDAQAEIDDTDHPSAISSAATSLGDRLSALLDSDETETKESALEALPRSLLQPVQTDDKNEAEAAAAGKLLLQNVDEGARSNLVSFPRREIVLEDPIAADLVTIDGAQTDTVSETSGLLVIDDLAADDVIRASRDPENPVFDPEGDPVENAMRYLERQASEKKAKKSNGGMWIPMALGALLFGASAVLIGRGATQMLSAWGPTAVTAAAITGGLTVLFALYAAARGRST